MLEIGPGPGFTTDVLRRRVEHLTAVEVDVDLAQALAARLAGTNVDVVRGDAGALEFPDDHFSGAASFHMLHHIETDDAQNAVFGRAGPGPPTAAAPSWPPTASRTTPPGPSTSTTSTTRSTPTTSAGAWPPPGFGSIEIGAYDLGWVCTAQA